MFVMLSVRTFAVCERKAEKGTEAIHSIHQKQQQQPPKCTTPTLLIDDLLLSGGESTPYKSFSTILNSPEKKHPPTKVTANNNCNNNKHSYGIPATITSTTAPPVPPRHQTPLQANNQHQQKLIDDIYANNNSALIGNTFTKAISFDKNLNKDTLLLTELNNFKHPPAVQAPVATILNDLSPIPVPSKVTNQKGPIPPSHMTPKGLQENSLDVKAMRYYRLWIYTCNAVLLMAVIVFCGVAGKVLMADYKRLLVGGLNLGQPSFIYAYLALLVQSGFIQLIGCLGALRLSERLLNAYWMLLLTLLLGDAMIGVFWYFKFERILGELTPTLKHRLSTEYGVMADFTELWDRLQSETRCCGLMGQDFQSTTNRSYPASCCAPDINEQISISRRPLTSAVVFRGDGLASLSGSATGAHHQKPNFSDIADMAWSHAVTAAENRGGAGDEVAKTIALCRTVFPTGCVERLATWMRNTADILFVLGYCVIAFLKVSFLGILRYEIKEMIQKIKLLQTELATSILGVPEVEQQQNCVLLQIPSNSVNNGGVHAEPKVGNRDRERNRIGSGESERESLLLHETTPKYLRTQKSLHAEPGEDASDAAKSINGNNNYELTEFDTKAPTYRLLNAPTVTKI